MTRHKIKWWEARNELLCSSRYGRQKAWTSTQWMRERENVNSAQAEHRYVHERQKPVHSAIVARAQQEPSESSS